MAQKTDPDAVSASAGAVSAELWAYRSLLAAVLGITFSIVVGEVFAGICLLVFLVAVIAKSRVLFFPSVFIPAILFVAVAVAVSYCGIDPDRSTEKLAKLRWFFLIPVAASLVSSPQRRYEFLKIFAFGCGVLALLVCITNPIHALGAAMEMQVSPGVSPFRVALVDQGSMTDGQLLMLGVLVTLGLVFMSRGNRKKVVGWLLLLALIAIALVVNFKRGSWFCTLVLVAAFLALRRKWKLLGGMAVLAVVVAIAVPQVRSRLLDLRGQFDTASGGRITMWTEITPAIIREYPLGIGYRALTPELMQKYAPHVEPNRDHLHSNIAQVLVSLGWLGLTVYLAWMAKAVADGICLFRQSRSDGEREQLVALVLLLMMAGLFLNGLVEYNMGDAELMIVYAALMGITGRAVADLPAIPKPTPAADP